MSPEIILYCVPVYVAVGFCMAAMTRRMLSRSGRGCDADADFASYLATLLWPIHLLVVLLFLRPEAPGNGSHSSRLLPLAVGVLACSIGILVFVGIFTKERSIASAPAVDAEEGAASLSMTGKPDIAPPTESYFAADSLLSPSQPSRRNLWAVVIGISKYRQSHEFPDLHYADSDAEAISATLRELGWPESNVRLLTNQQATRANVLGVLENWLQRAAPDDLILFYWAGHAWSDSGNPDDAFFACADSNPSVPSSGLGMNLVVQELMHRDARNVVVIADACHSDNLIPAPDPSPLGQLRGISVVPRNIFIPAGWVFITSSREYSLAHENARWRHGALTYLLLQGLRRKEADGYPNPVTRDGRVTLGELRHYVTDQMPVETRTILGRPLTPLFLATDDRIWNLCLQEPLPENK
jgi:hypothetical protein